MKVIEHREVKKSFVFKIFFNFCNYVIDKLYSLGRYCEKKNGTLAAIEEAEERIKDELENSENIKKEKEFFEDVSISKDEHIQNLYMFIAELSINFRNNDFEKVDQMLRRIKL